jgi:hypothetical protein
MKYILSYIFVFSLLFSSCLIVEEDPIISLNPSVDIQASFRNNELYVTSIISANPTYVQVGNIPARFTSDGSISIYNETNGTLIDSYDFEGQGITKSTALTTDIVSIDDLIIVVSGTFWCYADRGSDASSDNDVLIGSSAFFEQQLVDELIIEDVLPVITLNPTVAIQSHIRNRDLYATATLAANPNYILLGDVPAYFDYDGVMQLYDRESGALLRSRAIDGSGSSSVSTLLIDTTGYQGFVLIVDAEIVCFGDVGSDNDASNDVVLTNAEIFEYRELLVE